VDPDLDPVRHNGHYLFDNVNKSDRPSVEEIQWESLLDRGLAYGIKTREQLSQEADVGHSRDIGSRLADLPQFRQDLELWEILLVAQALRNGHDGIKATWFGMIYRGAAVRLEDKDPRTNALWRIFLSAGAEDPRFLWQICKEAKLRRYKRPRLLAEVVGAALEGSHPSKAHRFATFIGARHYGGRQDLLSLFSAACQSPNPEALGAFSKVYDCVRAGRCYEVVIPALWEQDRADDAFMMHSFLVSRKDLPPRFELLEPFIHHMALYNKDLEKFMSQLQLAGARFDSQAKRLWSIARSRVTGIPADSLNIVASKTIGKTPSKLSDQFIARAFATSAFSFDFAVNSLRLVGLIEVGPLAIRQLALTSGDLVTLQARFQKLQELEIDLGASTFVRVLKHVCDAGRWEVVQALVDNDLHHEVFDDTELQTRLLAEYYRRKDWTQLNRTLAILNDGHFDEASQIRSAQMLFTVMIETQDWTAALIHLTSMQWRGWPISPRALLKLLQPAFFTTAPFTFRQPPEAVDRPALMIGLMQSMSVSTSDAIKWHYPWRQGLRMLGRQGRLAEFEHLVYWIAEFYKSGGLKHDILPAPAGNGKVDLNEIFDEKFQKSLMAWCFRPHVGMTTVSVDRCLKWTGILKRLRDGYGVAVREHVIRWEFTKRLRRVFAPAMELKRPNALMRARNRASIVKFWEKYDQLWDMRPQGTEHSDRIEASLYSRKRSLRNRRQLEKQRWFRARTLSSNKHANDNIHDHIVVYRDLFNASWDEYNK
jgi:hypothetical protein